MSVFCDFSASMNLNMALASATLLFFAMVDGFNAIRAQDRFGSDYSGTKKDVKDANARANALAALIFIQFVLSLAQVWVASTRLRLSKAEPSKETALLRPRDAVVASKEPSADASSRLKCASSAIGEAWRPQARAAKCPHPPKENHTAPLPNVGVDEITAAARLTREARFMPPSTTGPCRCGRRGRRSTR